MKRTITIALTCFNFQRRLCWLLSSIAEQRNLAGSIILDIAFPRNNGNPNTESVLDYFVADRGLSVVPRVWDDPVFDRGVVRGKQLQFCKTEWLLYTDADMVYHPDYFASLFDFLESGEWYGWDGMLSAGRMTMPIEQGDALVEEWHGVTYIPSAFGLASKSTLRKMRNCGTGYSQLIHPKTCPHLGGVYSEFNCREGLRTGPWLSPSDILFRRRVGKREPLPDWFSTNQIHLNHRRDPEENTHLVIQR